MDADSRRRRPRNGVSLMSLQRNAFLEFVKNNDGFEFENELRGLDAFASAVEAHRETLRRRIDRPWLNSDDYSVTNVTAMHANHLLELWKNEDNDFTGVGTMAARG